MIMNDDHRGKTDSTNDDNDDSDYTRFSTVVMTMITIKLMMMMRMYVNDDETRKTIVPPVLSLVLTLFELPDEFSLTYNFLFPVYN